MASHGNQCSCSAHHSTPSVHQTLDEMDFERGDMLTLLCSLSRFLICNITTYWHALFFKGIWSAALVGDLERAKSFLTKGTDPNIKDQAGYTALVSNKTALYLPVYY